MNGRKMFHMALINLVGWTRYSAFKFFLYLACTRNTRSHQSNARLAKITATTASTYITHQCTTAAQLHGAWHRALTKPKWRHGTEGVRVPLYRTTWVSQYQQEAQLSLSDRAMRLVSSNLAIATQQCRNYSYDKSWPNWWYEVGGLVGGNMSWTMCTQPWRDRVGSHCLRCHKQTDDGRVVYITCILTTCCGKIF